jgi:pimeloyl-ACP methyl ester carboxylesterase
MPRAIHDGIEIEYATLGDPADPALLLVNGLGGQLIGWDIELVEAFVDRGFLVIRFDNRDTGLSSRTPPGVDVAATLAKLVAGESVAVPYLLADMADDALAVADDLGVDAVHVVGQSLGGMIAQTFAIRHPQRTASLTSAMERQVSLFRTIGSPDHFDEGRVRRKVAAAYDRSFHPYGIGVQMLAIVASGSRAAELARLAVPTLVIHGEHDAVIDVSGGTRTAELVPGAELDVVEGMGHDLPSYFWPRIVEGVTKLAARSY